MVGDSPIQFEKYSLLEDFSVDVEVDHEDFEAFSLCFWVYLFNSTTFPATIIRQVHSDMCVSAPFLVLDENKKMMLLPLTLLHKEAPDPENTASWMEVPNVSTEVEFPLEKWVHVGCEVSRNYLRLHIDGKTIGEKSLTSLMNEGTDSDFPRKISLFSVGGDGYSVQGFNQNAEVLPLVIPVKDHYMKDPPLQLTVDKASTSETEVDDDGVWIIVGGKASCRRIFSLDVVLSNAVGQPINKELEVVASLLYADSGTPVEKSSESEAPLLASYDGVEFSASDRPSKLSNGCASFKLKISQLSSKCDNRLFCIKFEIPRVKGYPFLEAFSNPIRCISRGRSVPKRTTFVDHHPPNGIPLPGLNNGSVELQRNASVVKQVRLGEERMSEMAQPDEECNSYAQTSNQFDNANGPGIEWRHRNHEEAENSSTDSENNEVKESVFRRYTISDSTIFRYCLGSLAERYLILKEIGNSSSDEEISEFADQVSLYSGCSHHSYQIKMARKLIVEGTKAWILISQNNQQVHWDNVVFEIEEQFTRIARCRNGSLAQQDFEFLRRIAGCTDCYVSQENFERMWCWLFPVAFTISRDWINEIWNSASTKWIEGFITKEEAELSLQGQEPGTFILRFPASRVWPHPDAGSLVVSYVGRDFALRHRLLSLHRVWNSQETYTDVRSLQDMLLAEPELSRLARIKRSHGRA